MNNDTYYPSLTEEPYLYPQAYPEIQPDYENSAGSVYSQEYEPIIPYNDIMLQQPNLYEDVSMLEQIPMPDMEGPDIQEMQAPPMTDRPFPAYSPEQFDRPQPQPRPQPSRPQPPRPEPPRPQPPRPEPPRPQPPRPEPPRPQPPRPEPPRPQPPRPQPPRPQPPRPEPPRPQPPRPQPPRPEPPRPQPPRPEPPRPQPPRPQPPRPEPPRPQPPRPQPPRPQPPRPQPPRPQPPRPQPPRPQPPRPQPPRPQPPRPDWSWNWGFILPGNIFPVNTARVRFYNAAVREPIYIYVNNRLVVSNLDYLNYTRFYHVAPGRYRITVYRASNMVSPIVDTWMSFIQNRSYTLTLSRAGSNFWLQTTEY